MSSVARVAAVVAIALVAAACGEDPGAAGPITSTNKDSGQADTGPIATDTGPADTGAADSGAADTGAADVAADVGPVDGGSADVTVVGIATRCNPCAVSSDCSTAAAPKAACVAYGDDGSFCANACATDSDCTADFKCSQVTAASGIEGGYCVKKPAAGDPSSKFGVCDCSAEATKAAMSTKCLVSGQIDGATVKCAGVRTCGDTGLTDCDAPEPKPDFCNGVDDDCDGKTDEEPAGDICGDSNPCWVGSCDAGKCKQTNKDGPCDADGDACTADKCEGGECKGGPAAKCDDGNPCTLDNCDATTGKCEAKPQADNFKCDDGDPCTAGEVCTSGKCAGGTSKCNDGNDCTDDSCEDTGCAYKINSGKCDDGDVCTDSDVCSFGVCKAGVAKTCDDSNVCTVDACDPKSGACTTTPQDEACDDGNKCTDKDACKIGKCEGSATDCDDQNACTTDKCDPAIGCTFDLNSAPCDDANKCTDFDKCTGGKCAGAKKSADACDDGNPCTKDACDIAVGCTSTNSADVCDDGNSCTSGDTCLDGTCTAGQFVCKCQKDGDCQQPADKCLGTLFCDQASASCKVNPTTVVTCDKAGDTECSTNKCDATSGKCEVTPLHETKPCDADGDLCTAGDVCTKGKCVAGAALNCNDQNPCTNDACLPKSGCSNTVNAAPCDADGNLCTEKDACANKVCVAGAAKLCNDGDACTTDACDAKTGKCVNDPVFGCGGLCKTADHCDDNEPCTTDACTNGKCVNTASAGKCDDGDVCTSDDVCTNGKCGGKKKVCNDSNSCTNDGCDPKTGCVHLNNAAPCDDFDGCTLGDTCTDGKCTKNTPKNCDDKDKCTTDQCNPGDGSCVHKAVPGCGGNCTATSDCDDKEPCTSEKCTQGKCDYEDLTGTCNDGDECTDGEFCTKGKCGDGKAKDCDDGNACTLDTCDKINSKCSNAPIKAGEVCDDGDVCTDKTTCQANGAKLECKGTNKNCDDGNVCTTNTCDPKSGGCSKTNAAGACEDGNSCTAGDTCANGACVTGTGVWVDTLAGSSNGFANGKGTAVKLSFPMDATVASKTDVLGAANSVYLTEAGGHRIRKIDADGTATTFAGSSQAGLLDGTGDKAWFNWPAGIDSRAGTLYVADRLSHAIRTVSAKAEVKTLAGAGTAGYVDGDVSKARFNQPWGIAVSAGGVVYVAEFNGHKIRKIVGNTVSTLAGAGAGYTDGKGTAARFRNPISLAVDGSGNVWVADYSNHRIRKVAPDGAVTTAAGSGAGFLNGAANLAKFRNPWGLAIDGNGAVLVGDRYNQRIRKIDGNVVSTLAGVGAGTTNGLAAVARFNSPGGLVTDGSGYVYIADYNNHRVRRIRDSAAPCQIGGQCYTSGATNPSNACQACDAKTAGAKWTNAKDDAPCDDGVLCSSGDKCTSGSCKGAAVVCDDKDKCTNDSCDKSTGACAFAPIVGCGGNCGKDADCDDKNPCTDDTCTNNSCANTKSNKPCDDGDPCTSGDQCANGACVSGDKTWVTTAAGGKRGFVNGKGAAAQFNRPFGVKAASDGTLWVADTLNHSIRKVAKDGTTTTFAGTGKSGATEGPKATAQFNRPYDLARLGDGTVYVADSYNHRIRKIDPAGNVSTFVGGVAGYVNGKGLAARVNFPIGLAAAPSGILYLTEYNNNRIRRILPDGTVTLLAGSSYGFKNGTGAEAQFRRPWGIAVMADGNLVVGDYVNHRIRKVTPSGVVTTFAGIGTAGLANGPSNQARFNLPRGVAADSAGNVFVADRNNHRIRKISASGFVSTFAGIGPTTPLTDGDASTVARVRFPTSIDVDARGSVVFGQEELDSIRTVWDSAKSCSVAGTCYADGLANPGKSCEQCDGGKTRKAWSATADGGACVDSIACTADDLCTGGKCAGKPVTCDDADKCTKDSCDSKTGACINEPTVGCNGYCGKNEDCDDKNVCTTNTCATDHKCVSVNNSAACDDGNSCSQGDQCAAGKCTAGTSTWLSTVAGSGAGFKDGARPDSKFNQPSGVAFSIDGSLFVADRANHRIRQVVPGGGDVITKAGSTAGYHDDKAAIARFNSPEDVVVGGDNKTLYVADRGNHRIRKIDPAGNVTTLAGASAGFSDGVGGAARFNNPYGIGYGNGHVYVADYSNRRIRRVAMDGTVVTIAGTGQIGLVDGNASTARFHSPIDVAAGPNGVLYVADYGNHAIRRVTANGVVTTFAGNGAAGNAEGTGKAARFRNPRQLDWTSSGDLIVTDQGNHRVRRVSIGGTTSFVAGVGAGYVDGDSKIGRMNTPLGIAVSGNGYIALADRSNHRIRLIRITANHCKVGVTCWTNGVENPSSPCLECVGQKNAAAWSAKSDGAACTDGDNCTIDETCTTGKCGGKTVTCDDGNKCTTDACDKVVGGCSHKPIIGCDGYCEKEADCDDGNPCTLGHTCTNNKCGQGPTDWVSTVAGSGAQSSLNGAADKATFNRPTGLAGDGKGAWLVAEYEANLIRKIAADGTVTTLAGSGKAGLVDGKGTSAWFNRPADIAFDDAGVAYVADRLTHSVRKVQADGTVSTWVGSGATGTANGKGGAARFNQPIGLAMSVSGTLAVADYANNRVRLVAKDGTVTTFAGGTAGFADAKGTAARFQGPVGVAWDLTGSLFVTDYLNNRIRKIAPDTTVTTVAGTGSAGTLDGSIKSATFNRPWGVGVNSAGNVFVTDASHHVRMIHGGLVESIAGSSYGHLDGAALAARFRYPYHVRVDTGGAIWVADYVNNRVRKVVRSANACHIAGVCYSNHESKPGDVCSVCEGVKASTSWSKGSAAGCK